MTHPHPYVREPHSYTLDFYSSTAATKGCARRSTMTPDADHRRGEGVGAARPRRRRLPDRHEVAVRRQEDRRSRRYICCNADESEPGTFKDHLLMERNPHLLHRGVRDRLLRDRLQGRLHLHPRRVPPRPGHPRGARSPRPTRAGYLGKNIFGSGFDCDVYVHRGAGAYEAGEETALIESLEGKRAQPRIKPPFPAVVGLYGCPTAVNNVETLCNVPPIIERGAEWFAGARPREERRPEAVLRQRPRGKPGRLRRRRWTRRVRELIYDYAGGIANGRTAEGGDSRRIVGADPAAGPDRRARRASTRCMKAGSMLGSAGMIVMDDTTCMVWAAQEPAALLPSRVVRQVHAVPRRRRLAVQDARQRSSAAKAR